MPSEPNNFCRRIAWPIDCVCRNMPDDDFSKCVRGCLRCVYDRSGQNVSPNENEHKWCFFQCGGLTTNATAVQALDPAIHCCAMYEGFGVGRCYGRPGPFRGSASGLVQPFLGWLVNKSEYTDCRSLNRVPRNRSRCETHDYTFTKNPFARPFWVKLCGQ
jgi:hypothetical protein